MGLKKTIAVLQSGSSYTDAYMKITGFQASNQLPVLGLWPNKKDFKDKGVQAIAKSASGSPLNLEFQEADLQAYKEAITKAAYKLLKKAVIKQKLYAGTEDETTNETDLSTASNVFEEGQV